jgi:hypothetical protein
VGLWIHDLDADAGGRMAVPHDEREREPFRVIE